MILKQARKWKFLISNSNGKRNIEGFYNEMHYQADSSAQLEIPFFNNYKTPKTTISLVASLIFHIFFHTKK